MGKAVLRKGKRWREGRQWRGEREKGEREKGKRERGEKGDEDRKSLARGKSEQKGNSRRGEKVELAVILSSQLLLNLTFAPSWV
jgi:hypothetical protein